MGLFSDRSEEDDLGDLSLSGLAGLDDGPEESVYPLDEWGEGARTVLRERLTTLGVPHEWDEDGSLVVATDDEAWVERILDQVEDELADSVDPDVPQVAYDLSGWATEVRDRLYDLLDDEAVPFGVEGHELFVHEIDEARVDELVDAALAPEVEPPAEAAPAEAMGDLFVAADLLRGEPTSAAGALGLLEARRAAGAAGAPYGMDAAWWEGVLREVDVLIGLLDAEALDDDAVMTVAARLRDGLRPYV
ncbi:MAG: hypothetical protein ACO1PW_06870 [Actinomycetota bacterium]